MLNNLQINRLLIAIKESKEYLSLMNKTQVLNNRKLEETATRGSHTNEVAYISKSLIETLVESGNTHDSKGRILNPKLAELIGLAHDLGHTPYGHDGEAQLNDCLSKIEATKEYLEKRRENFGDNYENEQQSRFEKEKLKDPDKKRTMQFEHNEHSAEIFLKICEEQEIDKSQAEDVVTGILAHSTSRVKKIPDRIEQQTVRLSDKIAYINRDIHDMLNEGILTIDDIPKDLREFVSMTPEERALLAVKESVSEYQRNGTITGGSKELAEIKKLKKQVLIEQRNIISESDNKSEIVGELLNKLPENKRVALLEKMQGKPVDKLIVDILKVSKKDDRINVFAKYDQEAAQNIENKENSIVSLRAQMRKKYPVMEMCYRLKDATDKAIFEKDKNGMARIGNDVKETQNEIDTLFNYYTKNVEEIPKTILEEYKDYTKEEQIVFYIAELNNISIQKEYNSYIEQRKVETEKTLEMHDQKSGQFFEDIESGKYNIPEPYNNGKDNSDRLIESDELSGKFHITDFQGLLETRRKEQVAQVTNETIKEVKREQTKEEITLGEER